MNDLFDNFDLEQTNSNCRLFTNDHKFTYDVNKSSKEESVFTCLCGAFIGEVEDSNAGC